MNRFTYLLLATWVQVSALYTRKFGSHTGRDLISTPANLRQFSNSLPFAVRHTLLPSLESDGWLREIHYWE